MNIKQISYVLALSGVLTGALLSVRIGALIIAAGFILFLSPDIKSMRPIAESDSNRTGYRANCHRIGAS